jgi:hypothetical protein
MLGSFPTGTLFTIARRLASSKLGVADDPQTQGLELEQLQSISKTNAERFYDEGIATIVQLAYGDPIDLTIRTNFEFTYVVDCVSQALLWIYFTDKTKSLAMYSLRGAQEASSLMSSLRPDPPPAGEELSSEARQEQAQAQATLEAVAAALGTTVPAITDTMLQVSEDPYTEFLCRVWQ